MVASASVSDRNRVSRERERERGNGCLREQTKPSLKRRYRLVERPNGTESEGVVASASVSDRNRVSLEREVMVA